MQGVLKKTERGTWEIVDSLGDRMEISEGTVIEVYSYHFGDWKRGILSGNVVRYSGRTGQILYNGLIARTTPFGIIYP